MTEVWPQGPRQPPIDWAALHRRLEEVRTAIERGWSPGPAEKQRILAARANMLAQQTSAPANPQQQIEVIEFHLAYERYGVESAFVREVFPLTDLTHLPCTPPFVRGIINVRGEIVSVIDLKRFFALSERGLTDLNRVIILHADSMLFGILADLVLGVRTIPTSELQPSLPALTGIPQEYLKGLTQDRTVVLDAAKLLAHRQIIVHEDVST
jgi:purine-binding chemotaxis protein CheW